MVSLPSKAQMRMIEEIGELQTSPPGAPPTIKVAGSNDFNRSAPKATHLPPSAALLYWAGVADGARESRHYHYIFIPEQNSHNYKPR
jgi:hypothetical protein